MHRYLDPRDYNPDSFLRCDYAPGLALGASDRVRACTAEGWGFVGGVSERDGPPQAAFGLSVALEGEAVVPAEGIWRPSHASLYARDPEFGVQFTEDKFLAEDTLVSVLSVRNPSPYALLLEVTPQWLWKGERGERAAPPGDELVQRIAGEARLQLVFALGMGESAAARAWTERRSPLSFHQENVADWFLKNAPRFDCPDPWKMRLYWHGWQLRRIGEREGDANEDFEGGDFERPTTRALRYPDRLIEQLLSPRWEGDLLTLAPDSGGLSHFCLDGWIGLTIVWDDPQCPGDAYDDGLKGLAIWQGERRVHTQPDLSPVTIPHHSPAPSSSKSSSV